MKLSDVLTFCELIDVFMDSVFKNMFNLFFPELCMICGHTLFIEDQVLCISCRSKLPLTYYSQWKDNEVERSFYGRVTIEAATSLLYYNRKGEGQRLIHQLKYKKQQQIGFFLGDWLGQEMIQSHRFNTVDLIIPVPLHKNKLQKRGYNQVTTFGQSLSEKLQIPLLEDVLIRVSKSKTQTFKSRLERSIDMDEKFEVKQGEILNDKHILLIDDVITTGATLEACCIQLRQMKNIKISIATMAYTL